MTHTILTQVTVTLDPSNGECNVSTVTEKVQKEFGLAVILLDIKLFPVTEGGIAVSSSTYEKAGGVLPDKEFINIDGDAAEPQSKRAKTQDSTSNLAIADVAKKLDEIDRQLIHY